MITKDDLKKMEKKELEQELQKAGMDLMRLRLLVSGRQSKETDKLKALRRYIARIKTIKQQRKLEQIKENAASAVIT